VSVQRVSEVLDYGLAQCPDKVAVVGESGQLSYRALDERANRVASALQGLGVAPGDRVAVSLPNDVDIVALFHGAMRLGAQWVGVNTALSSREKSKLLAMSDACLLFCTESVAADLRDSNGPPIVVIDPAPSGDRWREVVAEGSIERPSPTREPHDAAAIAFTSGSTGDPKGVVHSEYNMLLPGAVIGDERGYDFELVKGDFLPLTILNVFVLGPLLAAQAGGTFVAMNCRDVDGIVGWIERERLTVWNGVPALFFDMVERDDITRDRISSLRDIWTGGAPMPEGIRGSFESKFNKRIHGTYGLTEMPTIVAIEPLATQGADHVPGSSGVVLSHVQVTVVDDEGRSIANGEVGRICVGAANEGRWSGTYRPMLGYLDNPEATKETVQNDVLITGDLGSIDDGGHVYVKDRESSLILRGGANVYPAEIERVIEEISGVAGVAVVGVPDVRLGQRVVAVVEPSSTAQLTEDGIVAYCRLNLARYKVPERVVFIPRLPRNAMNKVIRAQLLPLFAVEIAGE
jgi:long-chain acyl-CoA synthetase